MSQAPILTGQSLIDLLDRARDLLADESDGSITRAERQAAVAELLHQHTLVPDNLPDLSYLHWLWLRVEQPLEANAALHRHRAAVLAHPQADASTAFHWSLLDVGSRWHIQQKNHPADHSEGRRQLASLLAQLHADPVMHAELGKVWGNAAFTYEAWDLMEAEIQWMHRQPRDEEIPAAWHEAMFQRRMADLSHRRGDEEAMERHIHTAVAYLQTDNENITLRHWLQLAEHVLQYAPQHIEIIVQAATAQLCGPVSADAPAIVNPFHNPLPSPAQRHYRLGLLARVRARAYHALGALEPALACARAGLYAFDEDDDDHAFAAEVMQWQMEADQIDAVTDLAAQGLLHARNLWAQPAWCRVLDIFAAEVLQWQMGVDQIGAVADLTAQGLLHTRNLWAQPGWHRVLEAYHSETNPQRLALWWCLLAWPGIDPDTRQLLQSDKQDRNSPLPAELFPVETCLAHARRHLPNYPLADWMEGVHLALQQQWQAALPLLEQGVAALPQHSNPEVLALLWCARLVVLPVKEALARPLPVPQGASWGYGQGVVLTHGLQKRLHQYVQEPHRSRLPALESLQAPLQVLAQRSYETAMAQFEAFFASGQGHYKTAAPHNYAMLCHNLSVLLKPDNDADYSQAHHVAALEAAIALEQKGMMASHFIAQFHCQLNRRRVQYNHGLLQSRQEKQAYVDAAEDFWDIAKGPQYTDYPPDWYLEGLTEVLDSLGRHSEISIWIDRLHQWYASLDAEQQRNEQFTFLRLLAYQLMHLHVFAPEQVRVYVQQYLLAVVALAPQEASGYLLYRFAWLLHMLQDIPQALELYRLAEHSLLRDKDENCIRQFLHLVHEGIASCAPAAERKKPFWKFWE